MDKQEAKEILENWLSQSKGSKDQCGYVEGWFYEDDEEAFSMAIEALQDDWVPVSERLPENGYWLWSATSGQVKKDFYWDGHWKEAEELGYEVVAWRPVPAPYTGCWAKDNYSCPNFYKGYCLKHEDGCFHQCKDRYQLR